jgi:bacterioferritin-associated ferredoxin
MMFPLWIFLVGHADTTVERYQLQYERFLTAHEISTDRLSALTSIHAVDSIEFMKARNYMAMTMRYRTGYRIFIRSDILRDTILTRLVVFHELSHVMGLGHFCNSCRDIMSAQVNEKLLEDCRLQWDWLLNKLARRL